MANMRRSQPCSMLLGERRAHAVRCSRPSPGKFGVDLVLERRRLGHERGAVTSEIPKLSDLLRRYVRAGMALIRNSSTSISASFSSLFALPLSELSTWRMSESDVQTTDSIASKMYS